MDPIAVRRARVLARRLMIQPLKRETLMRPKFMRALLFLGMTLGISAFSPTTQAADNLKSTMARLATPARSVPSTVGDASGTRAAATPRQDNDYAAREARAPQAAKFKGGDSVGIYLGGSTVAVILLVVLLVILL
jgi:hypothetical protein